MIGDSHFNGDWLADNTQFINPDLLKISKSNDKSILRKDVAAGARRFLARQGVANESTDIHD
jgi:hypothetical protein